MSGICLFTKYHIQKYLFYICSLLQIFAISCRTAIFYAVEKECIWEKCEVSKVAFEKEKEKSNNSEDMSPDLCKRNEYIKPTILVVLTHSVHLNEKGVGV